MTHITARARYPFLGWHPTKIVTRATDNGIKIHIYPKKREGNIRVELTEEEAIQLANAIADILDGNTAKE
ncbi:MAG TPA: hypothetical protein H9867_01655 [Candidatus Corynebacterium gallistercoris]|uniref:Uncharacterized protein n=1 Tax=Candidatus Corynebacterium gallistercoris TaxID=2838530 RepID=A0A9D1RXM8_9CORY|nr:hypothetical protein [Candidatus Corynebacterium gallistercoris]